MRPQATDRGILVYEKKASLQIKGESVGTLASTGCSQRKSLSPPVITLSEYTDGIRAGKVVQMPEEISLLDTHVVGDNAEVEQCILPLVVLFSIAAQENRGRGVGRLGVPRASGPYQRVPNRAVTVLPPTSVPRTGWNGYMRAPGIVGRRQIIPGGYSAGRQVRRGIY